MHLSTAFHVSTFASSYGLVIFFLPFTLILHLPLPPPEISEHRLARSTLDIKLTERYIFSENPADEAS